MAKRSLWLIIGAVIIIAAIIIGIQRTQKPIPKEKVIKIGAILPLTGPGAFAGSYVRDSIRVVKEVYARAFREEGFELEFYIEDSKSEPKGAIAAYRKITISHPQVLVILTQMSSVASALTPLAKDEGRILVSISSTTEPLKLYEGFFANYIDADSQARLFIDFFNKKFSKKNKFILTIYYLNDEYGRSVKDAIVRQVGVKDKEVIPVEWDFNTLARDLISRYRPQGVVILVGYGKKMAEIIQALRTYGYQGPILSSAEIRVPDILELLGNDREGVFAVDFTPLPTAVSRIYESVLRRKPTIVDVLAYNGVVLVLESYLFAIKHQMDFRRADVLMRIMRNPKVYGKAPSIFKVEGGIIVYRTTIRGI